MIADLEALGHMAAVIGILPNGFVTIVDVSGWDRAAVKLICKDITRSFRHQLRYHD
jgi:hypothetical protein